MGKLSDLKQRREARRKPRTVDVPAWDTRVLVIRLDDFERLEMSDLGEQYDTDDQGKIRDKRDVKHFAATLLQRCLRDEDGSALFGDLKSEDPQDVELCSEGFDFLLDEDFSVLNPLLTVAMDLNGLGAHSDENEAAKKKSADDTGE